MSILQKLLDNNRQWAARMTAHDPDFFLRLLHQQSPKFLWIGCADSRVPANEIVGLQPGELFVHRNVANLVSHTDMNCLSVLQYAIEVLKVEHILVCGHYGCGGVHAALDPGEHGLIDNWLREIRLIASHNGKVLAVLDSDTARLDRLCELNVAEQAANVCSTTFVQQAWRRGQSLSVHGLIYRVSDGVLRDLGFAVTGPAGINSIHSQTGLVE
ncbi:MAG: carbonate dehydratase [Deltaproteobacteria bacterium]|nr:carbonate dehydratase [Deltaproteobacteria bacterium]MBI3388318.1 carbonate dehydratase [Deltaproteobacteria bacterium]